MRNCGKQMGHYQRRRTCRFCGGEKLVQVMSLGDMPLAGAFLKSGEIDEEKYYPLDLNICEACYLVQVSNVVPAEVLFKKNYFFFSSAINTLVEHFDALAREVCDRFLKDVEKPAVLEMGCNDGVLLKPLAELGVRTIGVDPATNVVNTIRSNDITIINDYFGDCVARDVVSELGQVDAFLTSYSFAHIDDMDDIMKGVCTVLKDDGVFIFELYYLGTLIDEMQYDMIYHEHMSYYSLKALRIFLRKYGMELFDAKYIPKVRSGAVRFYARRASGKPCVESEELRRMQEHEDKSGYDKVKTYEEYARKVEGTKNDLMAMIADLKGSGKRIAGYGASGRGTVIMNYCGIDRTHMDYVVDDAPAKQGYLTPGTHVPIRSWDSLDESEYPDYIVLFAWAFTDEVMQKRRDYLERGGKFIIPLPSVRIVSKDGYEE